MSEYITKDAVFDLLHGQDELILFTRSYKENGSVGERLCNAITRIPAADVEPVVRGEWQRMKLEGDMAIYSKCSVCGYVYNGSTFLVNYMKSIVEREHNYCPNCGAKMK